MSIEGIRARLEDATPGPWELGGMDSGHSKYEMDIWVNTADVGDFVCHMDGLARSQNEKHAKDSGSADAWFIAHAPEDMRRLLGALEAVLNVVDGYMEGDFTAVDTYLIQREVRDAIAAALGDGA